MVCAKLFIIVCCSWFYGPVRARLLNDQHLGGDENSAGSGSPSIVIRPADFADIEQEQAPSEYGHHMEQELARNPAATKVLFDHMPKAAGTYLVDVLRAALGDFNVKVVPEFQGIKKAERPEYFSIGSIRNPCEYYVSLWAFGADGKGEMVKLLPKELYQTTSTWKDSPSDIDHFRKWLEYINKPGYVGTYSMRLMTSYAQAKFDKRYDFKSKPASQYSELLLEDMAYQLEGFKKHSIDCWINTESIDEDLEHCLKSFESNNGHVNWRQYQEARTKVKSSMDQATVNPSKHGNCTQYYDKRTMDLVKNVDHVAFREFGFDCCSGEVHGGWSEKHH